MGYIRRRSYRQQPAAVDLGDEVLALLDHFDATDTSSDSPDVECEPLDFA
jgi:hypothetical protein